jgi:hypothetical protein
MPADASLIVYDADGIAQRVRRLMRMATLGDASHRGRVFNSKAWPWACFAAILILAILSTTSPSALRATHDVIEIVVSKLQ